MWRRTDALDSYRSLPLVSSPNLRARRRYLASRHIPAFALPLIQHPCTILAPAVRCRGPASRPRIPCAPRQTQRPAEGERRSGVVDHSHSAPEGSVGSVNHELCTPYPYRRTDIG